MGNMTMNKLLTHSKDIKDELLMKSQKSNEAPRIVYETLATLEYPNGH